MRTKTSSELFLSKRFLRNDEETVIVLPSPHGEYKSGISYSDACAAGEMYARLRNLGHLDVRTPELLGDDVRKNLILIGGKKANPVAKEFQSLRQANLSFDLDGGVIYDKNKQVVLTPEYANAPNRTLANVITDYGLIIYTDSPFGSSTKILHLAGIKGFGTLAAAVAVVDAGPVHRIEKLLRGLVRDHGASRFKNGTVEVLVKVSVSTGRLRRDSVQIEKISLSSGRNIRTWESESYRQLKPVNPHRLYIQVTKTPSKASIIRTRIDGQEIKLAKSADRLNAIYLLAKQARDDYLSQSENTGWVRGIDLAETLWQVKHKNGGSEIAVEMKREISSAIRRWANHLEKQGWLLLPNNVKVDHDYINSEILVFDLDVKKKVVDLVHMINHEQKSSNGPGFQLIESKPRLGYRINFHPALIFITESNSADPQ